MSVSDAMGFTLIELMIVVMILGLLVAVAVPAFQSYVKKAKSVEGEMALSEIQQLEDHYFDDNLQYSASLSTIGFNPSAPLKYYTITIQLNGAGPPPFLYQATATANLDEDPDLDAWVLTVDTNGSSTLQHGCIPGGVGAVQFDCTD
ncbi:MAG TPA: type IV pilin protein [Nitrospirales bacterium]|jgi:type IV pilus assembly protein PilE|nr:type IV pilin protein [Nitrospirales bacterium]